MAVSEIVTFFIEHRILLAGVLGVFLALLFFWLKITQFIFKFQENQSQEIINTIHTELEPFTKYLLRPITDEDVEKLTEIKIKKITKGS